MGRARDHRARKALRPLSHRTSVSPDCKAAAAPPIRLPRLPGPGPGPGPGRKVDQVQRGEQ
eukprot:scaffold35059_cov96-Isochrysis_galbana.AAC.2